MAVARVTEIIAGSKKSFADAVDQGVARAAKTLKNVEGAWVQDQKVVVEKGKIVEYRGQPQGTSFSRSSVATALRSRVPARPSPVRPRTAP